MSRLQMGLGGLDPRVELQWLDSKSQKREGTKPGPGDYGRKLEHDRMDRFYEVHVPPSYKAGQPIPVVLVFHGGGGYPSGVRYQSSMDNKADKSGFIVVYPAGTNKGILKDRLLNWHDGRLEKDGNQSTVDDVGFVAALLDDLETLFSVDNRRIYAAGISNGAQFAYYLVGHIPQRIAAVAAIAGQRLAASVTGNGLCPSRPMPIIQFSGTMDTYAPYNGGSPPRSYFITVMPPVEDVIQSWARCNQCKTEPVSNRKSGQATELRYEGCSEESEVILWTLGGGGHTWPGGRTFPSEDKWGVGAISHDINATDEMWNFFIRHSL